VLDPASISAHACGSGTEASSRGVQIEVPDRWALDKAFKRLLERFL
jgi:hypothetical protein